MPTDVIYRETEVNGQLARQRSTDGGQTWTTETLLGPTQSGTGTGDAHTTQITNNQTKVLIGILAPFLIALMAAATSWLQSVGTSHEVNLKEALAAAVKEVLAGQQKEAEGIKKEVVKPSPVVVVPPGPVPHSVEKASEPPRNSWGPSPAPNPLPNPFEGMSTEAVDKLIADYIKARQDRLKK